MKELINAKAIMIDNNYKLVVVKGGVVLFSSFDRGIKPVYDVYTSSPQILKDAYISDRVTGKAAAMILSKAGISGIYTELISEQAVEIFYKKNIYVVYAKRVDHILNREKNGSCPIEKISKDLSSEDTAKLISEIEIFLKSL
ncbi:MAG: DUF1893 domain-containing protein [Gudongella sp.]|nr:DUF1893 domain-containing protein [Gudongella sp.]